MNLEYSLDVDEIGAVTNVDGTTIMSYRDGSDFGVKAVDSTTKAVGTYEGLEFRPPTTKPIDITKFNLVEIFMEALPAGSSIEFWYQMNKSGTWIRSNTADGQSSFSTANAKKAQFLIGADADIYEPKVVINPTGNTSPEILAIRTYFV